MLSQRLNAFRARADFTTELMAQFLGVKHNTYVDYTRSRNPKQPPFSKKLIPFATRMMVSLDWLAGIDGATMWSEELLRSLRLAVRTRATEGPTHTNHTERICDLLRFTHRFQPDRYDGLLLAAVCGKPPSMIESVLAGETHELPHPAPDHLAEFLNLNPDWLLTGNGPPYIDIPSHRAQAVYALDDFGISNETILENIQTLRDLERIRAATPVPIQT